ncbi:MAG: hypothetical protein AMS18_10205 [Gemmatimonas sp. SG8_17]|nr:MAG: hypothetical protein AMS18_10205 [Gemmatimonas sp. SG8_17]
MKFLSLRAVACVVVTAGLACSEAQHLDELTRQYFEHHNRHDLTSELACFADDAVFEMPGWPPLRGKDALRDQFAFDSVLDSEITVGGLRVLADTVIIDSLTERNDFFRLMGIPEVRYLPGSRLVYRAGQIQKVQSAQILPADMEATSAAIERVLEWLHTAHPELGAEIESGALFHYNAETANLWLQLLREWRGSVAGAERDG